MWLSWGFHNIVTYLNWSVDCQQTLGLLNLQTLLIFLADTPIYNLIVLRKGCKPQGLLPFLIGIIFSVSIEQLKDVGNQGLPLEIFRKRLYMFE